MKVLILILLVLFCGCLLDPIPPLKIKSTRTCMEDSTSGELVCINCRGESISILDLNDGKVRIYCKEGRMDVKK